MTTYKDTQKKISDAKRTIKVDCVSVEDGRLVDENGPIAQAIADALPAGVEEFTIRIQVPIQEEET